MKVTKGLRLHIGFFGKRNAGKSTIVNNIIGQDLSIVSNTKGTTTDVNEKSMELLPVGPVCLLDTAGIDDTGELGTLRVQKTLKALNRCDVAVFVCDNEKLSEQEKEFISKIKQNKIPLMAIVNKTDIKEINKEDFDFLKKEALVVIKRKKDSNDDFRHEFKKNLAKILPGDFINGGTILSDIVKSDETCVLVIPIDKEAPKGRIILPQVNTLRELLDNNSTSIVCTEKGLKKALDSLKNPPKLVVTDSQAFKEVSGIVPEEIMLTSFSILFARLKGDLTSLYEGAKKIDDLKDEDKILILESCSHHPVEDDIGRVKIPNLIKKYTGKDLIFEHYSGHDFPEEIKSYSLIIHCGACMTTRKEVINRINLARENGVQMTNYGIAIAKCTGILERAIKPLLKK